MTYRRVPAWYKRNCCRVLSEVLSGSARAQQCRVQQCRMRTVKDRNVLYLGNGVTLFLTLAYVLAPRTCYVSLREAYTTITTCILYRVCQDSHVTTLDSVITFVTITKFVTYVTFISRVSWLLLRV